MTDALPAIDSFLIAWLGLMGRLSLLGVVLLGVALVADGFFRRRALTVVHALWSLVVFRFLLPPGLAFRWSVAGILFPCFTERGKPAVGAAWVETSHLSGAVAAPTFGWWRLALFLLWLVGAGLVGRLLFCQWRRSATLLAGGTAAADRRLGALVAMWRRRLGIRRRVRVVHLRAGSAPFTMGLLRPVVGLPADSTSWPSGRLEAVLAHELAHVSRLDILWLRLENAVQALFFFHPAVWLAPRRLGRLRELLCDRLALSGAWIDAEVYARSLLETLRAVPAGGPLLEPAGPALAETKEGLKMRLCALQQPAGGTSARLPITIASLVLLGGLLLPMAPAAAGSGGLDAADGPADVAAQTPPPAAPAPGKAAAAHEPVLFVKGSGLSEPRRIEAPQPIYPEEARRQGIQGTVVLQATIGTDGAVHDLKVIRPLPGGLTEAAEEAVRRWVFEPARNAKGEPVPVLYTLAVHFALAGGPVQYSSDGGLSEPHRISTSAPVYPEEARQQGIQGTVVLDALVGTDGAVHDVRVVRSLPGGLTEAAEKTVRRWKFDPAARPDGTPVAVSYTLTVRFRLDGGAAEPPAVR